MEEEIEKEKQKLNEVVSKEKETNSAKEKEKDY